MVAQAVVTQSLGRHTPRADPERSARCGEAMSRRLTMAWTLVSLLAAFAAVPAQQPVGTAPSRGPGWLPRESHLSVGAPYSRAEMAEVITRLEAIEKILLKIDEFAHPDGFEIEPNLYEGSDAGLHGGTSSRGTVFGYAYALLMYVPTRKIAGEGSNCVTISMNVPFGANQSPYSNAAGVMFTEEDHGDPVPGATYVWNRLSPTARSWVNVMFTSGGAPFWKTVTRGDFLDAVLVHLQGDPQKMAAAKEAAAETPYQRWMAGAQDRKQLREMVIGGLSPAEAAAKRRRLEEEDRKTTEELKAGEAKYKASSGGDVSVMTKLSEDMRARIAAMTLAERRIPAWLDRRAGQDPFPFVAPNSEPAVRVLQFDPDFFRARRSRVEARTIHVRLSASLSCETPVIHRAVYKALHQLDWAALARLLEP